MNTSLNTKTRFLFFFSVLVSNKHCSEQSKGYLLTATRMSQQLVIICVICSVFAIVKMSHVCVLRKRADPSYNDTIRWSLPSDERCQCQMVIASSSPNQAANGSSCEMWFVDDPTSLTRCKNWNKKSLDKLLERADFCG